MRWKLNKNGVSLAELLAVVVVMGIIAAIAIPLVGRVIETSKRKAYLGDLVTVTEALRIYCMTENTQTEFVNLCTPREFSVNNGVIKDYNKDLLPLEIINSSKAEVFSKYLSKAPSDIASEISFIFDGSNFYLVAKGDKVKHPYDTGGKFINPKDIDSLRFIVDTK